MSPTLAGALWMIAAMAAFALEDLLFKQVTATLPPGEALVIFGALGTLIYAGLAYRRGERLCPPDFFRRIMVLRSASELCGRLFFGLALAYVPLSTTSAILQATPLVVAAGAVWFFGETVGWRRWTAICVGFAGVLMILRPGLGSTDPALIFAVLGTLGFAGRDLATRASPRDLSARQLGIAGFAMLCLAGVLLTMWSGDVTRPDAAALGKLLVTATVGVCAYFALTRAMRSGDISVVAPFRYVRLVYAMLLGIVVLGERPDAMTLIGSAVIVASGLYTLIATSLRARAAR
ncbi:EamA family transporter [Pacificitalea manganoxidans]|uniref:EamA family transporter n=1 Tax=Pacificitalea manganoxidans TaxID=1411902 RepID=A0A291M074_9RHOB|nr:DMT family transporter [Pacificitalea manganoxidans]ATI42304.1 EamA family transporter [Pacificitalea manganoxidans]MBF54520.1 EamA/RhaT family transporter [Actibacterium sp.]MDR6307869.1 drug/metabolite transporter (DMT)-like permease [Pacificitalea manganoxidans]OWU71981.1 membrane protein [Roseovarius sp. 22II1-1F6A]